MSRSHDIDAVVEGVRSVLPAVKVEQLHQPRPADDNGLWFFCLPDTHHGIQIESSTYDCPFLIECDDMTSASQAFTVKSVSEAVTAIVSYLRSASAVF